MPSPPATDGAVHRRSPSQQSIARWSAVTVPLMIVAVVSWATYVLVAKLALARLFRRGERGAGIAVIVVHCVLLFATAVAYMRILATLKVDPGLVPLGRGSADEGRRKKKKGGRGGQGHQRGQGQGERKRSGAGLEQQGQRGWGNAEDVFEDEEGRTWAERQYEEKLKRFEKFVPREVVGGIVSETSMKFFIQFTFYASLLAPFLLITDGVLLARDRHQGRSIDSHMIALLAFAGLFTLFAVGIFGNTFFMTVHNFTTVEALNRANATFHISVLITPSWCNRRNDEQYPFRTTTYPGAPGALYAILMTRPGDNPWDVGRLENLKSVMGESVVDWFLPLKFSPCTNHDRQDSEYEFGPAVENAKREATGY
ncbi:palmitoyltransferase pfa5 [Diplodia intermedia]|uniref:Palmitoyltransferase pfa5 n=1 Tax=Diplodia intermedia TaxID=856260 RepID=A0ABR3TY04_9PEZI